MVVRVQKVGDHFTATIPQQMVDEFGLVDGSALEVSPVNVSVPPTIRYATREEVMKAYRDTLPQHEEAYRLLAK